MKKNTQHAQHTVCFHERPLVTAVRHALPYVVGLSLAMSMVPSASGRSGDSAAAFTATQLVRQFTLKNTVTQVSQGMQGYVADVSGNQRGPAMGARPSGFPADMGSVPNSVNLPRRDGAGRPLGYCAWDNNSAVTTADYNAGQGIANPLVYAIVSPGLNGSMQTTCADVLLNGVGLGDDHVQVTAPMQVSSKQYKTSVGTFSDLATTPGEEGDIRLVRDTNKLYSYVGGAWAPVQAGPFQDNSAVNGAGAISYTTGTVTVADFQAATAAITGTLSADSATFTNGVVASSFTGNGAGLTDLNAANFSSGIISPEFGGTGVNGAAAGNGTLLIGNGSGFTLGTLTAGAGISVLSDAGAITISNTGVVSITGTADQIITSANNGDVVLSLPQSIATTSTPTFGGLMLSGALTGTTANFSGAVSALRLSLADSTGGVVSPNVVIGSGAMGSGTPSGNGANTALGVEALRWNTSGSQNVAVGFESMRSNSSGFANTVIGYQAGSVGTVSLVTAIGHRAAQNMTGSENVAVGHQALRNAGGAYNAGVGNNSLAALTVGGSNSVLGHFSFVSLGSGSQNVGVGHRAGNNLTSGSFNVFIGESAGSGLVNGSSNTSIGDDAFLSNGLNYATVLGANALATTSNTIVLGRTTDSTVIGATGTASSGILQNKKLQVTGDVGITGNVAIGGTFTATGFSGNGSGLTDLNASNINSGVLAPAYGGTGVNGSAAANGALLIGNGTGYTLANLTAGTGVSVTNGAGSITIANTGVTSFNGRTSAVVLEFDDVNSAISSSGGYRIGGSTLSRNTTGYDNIAFGFGNLDYNTTGSQNVAIGHQSMTSHSPVGSTAVGYFAHSSGNGSFNAAFGRFTLLSLNGGSYNTALGNEALRNVSSGAYNTGSGSQAGLAVTTGSYNTFIGYQSNLSDATQRTFATAIGAQAVVGSDNTIVLGRTTDSTVIGATGTASSGILQNKKLQVTGDVGVLGAINLDGTLAGTTGTFNGALTASRFLFSNTASNIAIGNDVLSDLESGFGNIGIGNFVLFENVSGSNNIAIGDGSQSCNETGIRNVAVGYETLNCLVSGDLNTAVGSSALYSTDGFGNTGIGGAALVSNSTGNENTGLGYRSGRQRGNVFEANQRYGSNNTFLGSYSHPLSDTLFYATAIGSDAGVSTDNTVALGRAVEDSVVIGATGTASSGILQNKKLQVTGDVGITGNLAIGGTFAAAGFSGNGSGLTDLNAGNINSGVLAPAYGGTGVNGSAAANGTMLIGNGTGYTLANLTAGAGIGITNGAGSITIANTGVTSFNARTGAVTLTRADVASAVTVGVANTAVGTEALGFLTTGVYNAALGTLALKSVTTGSSNSAFGVDALEFATGSGNTAVGRAALRSSSGDNNTAIGLGALESNGSGTGNVAIGNRAGYTNSSGANNTFLGGSSDAGSAGLSYVTALGASSYVTTNNTIVLGRTSDVTVIGATGNDGGGDRLQVTGSVKATAFNTSSDRRLKYDIAELDNSDTLSKLQSLKSYSYRFNSDPTGKLRYGVIAQEVANLFPNAVGLDARGLYTVDYGALGAIAASAVGHLAVKFDALNEQVTTNRIDIDTLQTAVASLDSWKNTTNVRLDNMQTAIDKNILDIAKHAIEIATQAEKVTRLEEVVVNLDEGLRKHGTKIAEIDSRFNTLFSHDESTNTLTVKVDLKVGNFTAGQLQAQSAYTQRLDAEMAKIRLLEVDNLRANSAVARNVQAEIVNTGSSTVYAGVGNPALLFSASNDGHYTVNTSALDGSYATATVIVNAGQARVVPIANEGIELIAVGNSVKAVAAGKSIKASWIKMG